METLPTLPPPVSLSLSLSLWKLLLSLLPPILCSLSLSLSACSPERLLSQTDVTQRWKPELSWQAAGAIPAAAPPNWGGGERQSRDGTGRGDKAGLAVVVPAVAAELSSKLCLRIWVC